MKQGFNINNYVEFVLTQRGADQLNQHHIEVNELLYDRTRLQSQHNCPGKFVEISPRW